MTVVVMHEDASAKEFTKHMDFQGATPRRRQPHVGDVLIHRGTIVNASSRRKRERKRGIIIMIIIGVDGVVGVRGRCIGGVHALKQDGEFFAHNHGILLEIITNHVTQLLRFQIVHEMRQRTKQARHIYYYVYFLSILSIFIYFIYFMSFKSFIL
jgi:hypothetical protein